ncbi:Histidine kinase-, DNA gyrase B-, and HSP90-like ATPase [Zunongwangia mangrovi]|uniref:histidine kinase n=1 Tax=Zunongwangia mangrovi TaxID=1334022 RepID=A0A1I1DJZ1_9FLAO|nr:HAMP domain-containing sensor histidine kinase [Zunongwangia mangrovi]SFB75289.1 Histidine kinase-, DNA gyrase B-, and HSP90-like ATPase [Zunongwangia mangrovi]
MTYKKYSLGLLLRLVILTGSLTAVAFGISLHQMALIIVGAILAIVIFYNLYKFITRRFVAMDDFFESVKYNDFSRRFVSKGAPEDLSRLHKGFNLINDKIREINSNKEAQYLYLQKILEMVDVGIISYNQKTGDVLWANEAIKKTLSIPSFKNIKFLKSRKPELFETIFEMSHLTGSSISIKVNGEKLKVLVSETVFYENEHSFKIILLQNIDETLNQNESEAWKKLLSVMTHEIMNSIAPISSLADTLQYQVTENLKNPEENTLDISDLNEAIGSIKKRSEGLMKFAKTYRSLNKVTNINRNNVFVEDLFASIERLMRPSLASKNIDLYFELSNLQLQVKIDSYLIEQVLINLIVNARDALQDIDNAEIYVTAKATTDGYTVIKVIDNGNGIPQEIQETIFVPFFTTKKNGSGIGLSLCKQIMMLHKGKIQIHSEENKGTAISLLF